VLAPSLSLRRASIGERTKVKEMKKQGEKYHDRGEKDRGPGFHPCPHEWLSTAWQQCKRDRWPSHDIVDYRGCCSTHAVHNNGSEDEGDKQKSQFVRYAVAAGQKCAHQLQGSPSTRNIAESPPNTQSHDPRRENWVMFGFDGWHQQTHLRMPAAQRHSSDPIGP
jgi:hypothetical protein